jgi:hypothetical protein
MTVRQFLRNLQTSGAFIAALTSKKWLMTIKKSVFRHWALIMNFFVAYFCIGRRGIFKGLSHHGGQANFSKKTAAPLPLIKILSNEPNYSRIHLAGQYLKNNFLILIKHCTFFPKRGNLVGYKNLDFF